MIRAQQACFGGNTYISPVCDYEQAARSARKAMGNFRQQHVSREETSRVLHTHGSRKGPVQKRPGTGGNKRLPGDNQRSLFDE